MRVNLPVTQQEYVFPDGDMLVSMTDTQGRITHCNRAFCDTSGYSYEELMGQPHNLIRHPDMPAEAFKDMWTTIGRGRPWSGIVKNRRKNGDHYWVQANATPIMKNGKPVGYMSVRFKPSRQEVQAAEALYKTMNAVEKSGGSRTFKLHAGRVRPLGWRDTLGKLHRTTLTQRLAFALVCMVCLGMLPDFLGYDSPMHKWYQFFGLLTGAGLVVWWFNTKLNAAIETAEKLATDIAGCNLTEPIEVHENQTLESLLRPMMQIHVNLRAVIGDVREEIEAFIAATQHIASGAVDLSSRTEAQASSLEQTAASMEELASTVRQTADTAAEVASTSSESTAVVSRSGKAISAMTDTMQAMEKSSRKISEIISVIEGIAFQTNILALNAAVEAARAGEQGRGFAVVASEVRALAQRSATAAKEIKDLIGSSTDLVSASTQQMATAAATIGEVVSSVNRTSDLIHQITSATKEQAIGIGQVNEAVNHLDSVTQQNAALVDSTTEAVSQLSRRTEVLERSVSLFNLGK